MLTASPSPAAAQATTPGAVRAFARWTAEPTAAAVPLIRSRVRAVLDGWRVTAGIADVLLLAVSELTGNVVLHAASTRRMRVGVTLRAGWLHLEVTDGALAPPRLPSPRTTPPTLLAEIDPDAETGRGLLMVELMAAETGGELTFAAGEFGNRVGVRVPAA
ncbi:ATP-binding protein [Streptomyces sp. NBC_00536]|uniref:ATP-binding protein n=1 Tax=Streptomyces sp. NBC_00536 TaxID=2975769 RepID=UPI002E80FB47|nr:ATP-binding protein [Streptomyces sp. NBC_00536]WUC77375.1 ATP-binding protein [Streptomyces sp. NBC_00536]